MTAIIVCGFVRILQYAVTRWYEVARLSSCQLWLYFGEFNKKWWTVSSVLHTSHKPFCTYQICKNIVVFLTGIWWITIIQFIDECRSVCTLESGQQILPTINNALFHTDPIHQQEKGVGIGECQIAAETGSNVQYCVLEQSEYTNAYNLLRKMPFYVFYTLNGKVNWS